MCNKTTVMLRIPLVCVCAPYKHLSCHCFERYKPDFTSRNNLLSIWNFY